MTSPCAMRHSSHHVAASSGGQGGMSTPPPSQRRGRLKKTPSRPSSRGSSARKSVRFAGAAEIPFALGSPVAFHLAGHTPQQWKNRTRSFRHRAVVQELKARELDAPSTPAAALALLHVEYCKELLATLESRGLMTGTVSTACHDAMHKNPRATLQRLRGMLRMANHLDVRGGAAVGVGLGSAVHAKVACGCTVGLSVQCARRLSARSTPPASGGDPGSLHPLVAVLCRCSHLRRSLMSCFRARSR